MPSLNADEQIRLILADLRANSETLHRIDTGLQLTSQRLDQLAEMQGTLKEMQANYVEQDRMLVELAGREGNSGKISEIQKAVGENEEAHVKNADKIKSLFLSRALIAGACLASGGGAAGLVKYFMS